MSTKVSLKCHMILDLEVQDAKIGLREALVTTLQARLANCDLGEGVRILDISGLIFMPDPKNGN